MTAHAHRPYKIVVDMHCHMLVPAAEALARPHLPPTPDTTQRFQTLETRQASAAMAAACRIQLLDADRRLSDMDAMGIDIQVISPAPNHYAYWADESLGREIARTVNDGLAEVAARHPTRMRALGTVPMQSPRLAVEEMKRCVRELGMAGVEISTNVAGTELSDPRFHPFFHAAQELGAILFLHPTGFTHGDRLAPYHLNNIIGNPLDSTVALAHLIYGGVLDEYPDLKICVAHGGGLLPSYIGRFDHAHRVRPDCHAHCQHAPSHYLKRMYFDTMVFDPDQLDWLVRKYGAFQVLLGTDYPYDMGETRPLELLQRTALTEDERGLVAGLNAARLLGLPS
ncbi:amidohydrolase family protein [Pigmentiphaga sp. GD03639]|uniref:amidohydrolase family protein n=1 Tax=Pigmentiphaga sp. GD03639 TaxID=2975354 RepID=UPI0024479737|nr:amidohydrolase family protein [Pigmentiphaga sp. GD03639]MDH2234711.1 amidohydrolase family protein [Pigmentiphaga sp. GD03639]